MGGVEWALEGGVHIRRGWSGSRVLAHSGPLRADQTQTALGELSPRTHPENPSFRCEGLAQEGPEDGLSGSDPFGQADPGILELDNPTPALFP